MDIKNVIIQEIKTTNATIKQLTDLLVTQELFVRFAGYRHALTYGFMNLLETSAVAARKASMDDVAAVLEENIADETGIVNGIYKEEAAHSTWRKWYLGALGISVESIPQCSAVDEYNQNLKEFVATGDVYALAGAVVFLEGQIPGEFGFIQQRRDVLFPEKFVTTSNDSNELQQQKNRACKYINDHIAHDAQAHFPDLLRVMQAMDHPDRIEDGVKKMATIKQQFYTSLVHHFDVYFPL